MAHTPLSKTQLLCRSKILKHRVVSHSLFVEGNGSVSGLEIPKEQRYIHVHTGVSHTMHIEKTERLTYPQCIYRKPSGVLVSFTVIGMSIMATQMTYVATNEINADSHFEFN